jgi:NAD-dependent dihydropyrimidine dehydrogenase PreA subunit
MRADGTFIGVEVDDSAAADPAVAKKLAEACPVDIFTTSGDGGVELVQRNLDECVLCRLCIDAAPGVVKILKLYDGEAALA